MTNSIWDDPYDLEKLANNYQRISYELSENPIEIEIEEVITEQLEHFNTPRIFTPSLQYQRNTFVRDILKAHKTETQEALSKMAVLGCGSLSLERFLLHILANLGFGRVISVDIDEQELAKGLKLMKIAQQNNKDIICGSNEDPVLIEIYRGKVISSQRLDGLLSNYISGNILNYDRRLFNVNCVCSTEVIEHLPIDDATKYMKLVLGDIRPELFIISTPNHEYNKAFGMEQGVFRHYDHKFEFSRDEFKMWLSEIVAGYKDYNHTIGYVGNLKGFTYLDGATQFAIFKKKELDTNTEQKMVEISCFKKVGHSIALYGLYALLRDKAIMAFTTWLNNNSLRKEDCVESFTKFWRIAIEDIVKLIQLPEFIMINVTHINVLNILEFACRFEIHNEKRDGKLYMNIPYTVTKEDLITYMNSN